MKTPLAACLPLHTPIAEPHPVPYAAVDRVLDQALEQAGGRDFITGLLAIQSPRVAIANGLAMAGKPIDPDDLPPIVDTIVRALLNREPITVTIDAGPESGGARWTVAIR